MSFTPILSAPLAVQIHALSAILAVLLGALVLFRRKGTPTHRFFGRVWAVLMLVVATSAIFINEIRLIGPFSPIHLFTLFTYAGITQGILAIRRGNVRGHQAAMRAVYFQALGLAGAFTLLPGRRLNQVLFGSDPGWTPSLLAVGTVLLLVGWFYIRTRRPMRRRGAAA